MPYQAKTPIAFLNFNRPDKTSQVVEALKLVKPNKIFFIQDGPRVGNHDDITKCKDVLEALNKIDWQCDIEQNLSDVNLGCKKRVASGLDWAFSRSERLIVLEDDCLPNTSFFRFCDDLLDYYAQDTRIMQICGTNTYSKFSPKDSSYFFSQYGPIWGWASWSRAWKKYDCNISSWPHIKKNKLLEFIYDDKADIEIREQMLDKLFDNQIDTWDYQWGYCKNINSGLSVIPKVNLVSNIGFGEDATFCKEDYSGIANLDTLDIEEHLTHPAFVIRNKNWEKAFRKSYSKSSILEKIKRKLKI